MVNVWPNQMVVRDYVPCVQLYTLSICISSNALGALVLKVLQNTTQRLLMLQNYEYLRSYSVIGLDCMHG